MVAKQRLVLLGRDEAVVHSSHGLAALLKQLLSLALSVATDHGSALKLASEVLLGQGHTHGLLQVHA